MGKSRRGSSGEQTLRPALPVIRDKVATLQQRLPHEHAGRTQPRRQRRSLLARGQAPTRWDGAQLLGGQRQTIGHGLACEATGGLETVRELYVPAGPPLSRPPPVRAALEQAHRGRRV